MIAAFVIVMVLIAAVFAALYGIYRYVFCHPLKKRPEAHRIPDSHLYRAFRDRMLEVVKDMERTSFEEIRILSPDGCRLYGQQYDFKKDAPLIIFFHGYRGMAAWDGYGFFKLCKKNGINLLLADQRAHGKSEGSAITFGIKERYDCKLWSEYAVERFGEGTDIFLAGVSMGAASVMMSAELGLPGNVRGIIADCGYSEPAAVIKETIRTIELPVKPVYQLVRLSAYLFGHFDLEAASALQAVKNLKLPILFIHGKQDSVVPLSMGDELYECCQGKKERLLLEGADHANSAMTDYEAYEKAVLQFMEQSLSRQEKFIE